ncbi:MAG TPA: hypothetical protein VFG10_00890 [Saprospiraceae bacterium]|nr:hypothetical protein [Saprospiraceae bacterium]
MRQPLKAVLSVVVTALFLLFAYASSWDDVMATSTNTTVAIKDCEQETGVSGQLIANLSFNHKNGVSIAGATGEIYITHQIASKECEPVVLQSIVKSFVTDLDGNYEFVGDSYLHNNSQDLIRVEVHIDSRPGHWDDWKSVQVKYYNSFVFFFNAIAPDAL